MARISWHGAIAKHEPASPLAAHIGRQMHALRQKRQITQRAAAAAAGLSVAFYCDLENGKRCPGAETLWKLSASWDVPVGYWFRGFKGE